MTTPTQSDIASDVSQDLESIITDLVNNWHFSAPVETRMLCIDQVVKGAKVACLMVGVITSAARAGYYIHSAALDETAKRGNLFSVTFKKITP